MIYLFRHGQTEWNRLKRFTGNTDVPMNETGFQQTRDMAEKLKAVRFDACYCSPKLRARQMAGELYAGEAVLDERLEEIVCGAFEGTEETPEAMQAFWEAMQTGASGVEDFRAFAKRNCDFGDMVAARHAGQNVLIVTHAANARVLNYYFSGKPEGYDFTKAVCKGGEFLTFGG